MNILELFAGSRSIGRIADRYNFPCFSIDIKSFPSIDLVQDIELLTRDEIPFSPTMIWASPDCSTYCMMGMRYHRPLYGPLSIQAKKADRCVKKTLEILSWFPNAAFYIENPVGLLRKQPFMQERPRTTVHYCQYGEFRQKPTDIWSNNLHAPGSNPFGWKPRGICKRGASCHEASPRGFNNTGTLALKDSYERARIPEELSEEIVMSTYEQHLYNNG